MTQTQFVAKLAGYRGSLSASPTGCFLTLTATASGRLALRAGGGVFHSRPTFSYSSIPLPCSPAMSRQEERR